MPQAVLLIRHAEPEPDLDTPASSWPLSADGRVAARRLGRQLAPRLVDRTIRSSDEVMARQTADELSAQAPSVVESDERLREVRRPIVPNDEDYRDAVQRYLRGEVIEGWERREEVQRRLDEVIGECDDGRAVFVTHGLAMTVWLGMTWPDLDVVDLWRSLAFPDAWLLDFERGSLARVLA